MDTTSVFLSYISVGSELKGSLSDWEMKNGRPGTLPVCQFPEKPVPRSSLTNCSGKKIASESFWPLKMKIETVFSGTFSGLQPREMQDRGEAGQEGCRTGVMQPGEYHAVVTKLKVESAKKGKFSFLL